MSIREQISTTIAELAALEAVQRHFDEILEQEEYMESQIEILEAKVAKELDDIQKLEGMSVQKLFHKVMGSVDEKKSQEREEYLEASLNLKEMQQSLDLILYEKEVLNKKIVDIKLYKERLENLKIKREEEIMRVDSEYRSMLVDIERRADNAWALIKEIQEVLQVGVELEKALLYILERFNNSEYWFSVNTGGVRSNSEIERNLQQAFKALSQARILHKRFNEELADINYRNAELNLDINVNELFPYFFRNFITDIMYKNKLQSAMHLLKSNISLVRSIDNNMKMTIKEQEKILKDLELEKDALLIQ